jgi:hypothetical protein
MRLVAFTIITFLYSINAFAIIGFEDAIFPELATSGRALAMGNAFLSKVDDASAAFYNPAGLGTVRYPHFHLSNFSIETNKGALSAATDGSLTTALGNTSKMATLDGMRQLLLTHPGTLAHSRLHALPNFTTRYFSFGYLLAKRTRATVLDPLSATGFEFADRLDHGPYAALNLSLFGGIIKAGVSAIILSRKELAATADPAATTVISPNSYYKGIGMITTFGARITLPFNLLPAFSATMHNGLNKPFGSPSGAGAPTTIPRSIDVGASITPQIGTATRIHLEADYKDLTMEFSDVTMTRRLLLGMELDFGRVYFFRLGYGDGFGSAGLGVRSKKLEFDLTTYAVDTTTSGFRGHEDRRFVLSISSGF